MRWCRRRRVRGWRTGYGVCVPIPDAVDEPVTRLFALVSEALAGATQALLDQDRQLGQCVVNGDRAIDELTSEVEQSIWKGISSASPDVDGLRYAVGILLILPELERSADLAEHIAQRALTDMGGEMTPVSRGIVQRMSEVALAMWNAATSAYAERSAHGVELDEADEELDVLHERLTNEVAAGAMSASGRGLRSPCCPVSTSVSAIMP